MKTKVEILIDESFEDKGFKKGMKGYVDGYIRSSNGNPYAVVVVGEKFYKVAISLLKAIK